MNKNELNERVEKLRQDCIALVKQFDSECPVAADISIKRVRNTSNGTIFYDCYTQLHQLDEFENTKA